MAITVTLMHRRPRIYNSRFMNYWFPAKPSGFGWGPPTIWQGWAFLVGWIALLLVGTQALSHSSLSSVVFFVGMIAVLLLVIFLKGEPRRLR
jgi:hypothetical protein